MRRWSTAICPPAPQRWTRPSAAIPPTGSGWLSPTKNSRNAVTHYQVLEEYTGFSHLQVRLETGRTHQIRVHMAYLGHPVAGDPVYGPKKGAVELGGQCLHARTVGFVHPSTGEYMEFTSLCRTILPAFLEKLRRMG